MRKGLKGSLFAALVGTLVSPGAWAYLSTSDGWNLPTGATEIGGEVFGLHMMMFWICVAIGAVVFGAMIYSIFAHRKSRGAKAASFHHSTAVEIVWTAIPFAILIAVAIPAAGTLIKMEDTRDAELTIKVTGYQWLWEYEYLGEDVKFFSKLAQESNAARQLRSGVDVNEVPNYLVDVDRPLVIPTDTKVRFLITSNDVIHAWWVSDLTVKKDAIPGYINEAWTNVTTPGIYRSVCAELCGRDHGFMPIVVEALPKEEFQAWLAEQRGEAPAAAATETETVAVVEAPSATVEVVEAETTAGDAGTDTELSKDALIAQGEKIFATNCAACHQASGQGLPPNFPSLVGAPKVVAADASEQIVQTLKGKGMMPPFAQLSDADIAAVITYTRNQWGNDAGAVQPADVAALR